MAKNFVAFLKPHRLDQKCPGKCINHAKPGNALKQRKSRVLKSTVLTVRTTEVLKSLL